ncbi:MAG: hypothetical protein JWN14_1239, partial [Chthonomonadales bacterium]|nr:hypothetical protein [Chthonomonadales bacterium]
MKRYSILEGAISYALSFWFRQAIRSADRPL